MRTQRTTGAARIAGLMLVLAAVLAPPLAAGDRSDEELAAHIRAQNAHYTEAYNAGDAAAAVAVFTDDVTIMAPRAAATQGRDTAQAGLAAEFAAGGWGALSLDTRAVERHGDFAYEIGTYAVRAGAADDSELLDAGDFVVIWQRQATGDWLIHVDIWNTNLPAG